MLLKVDNSENEFNIKARLKMFFVQPVIQPSRRFNLWIKSSVFTYIHTYFIKTPFNRAFQSQC